MGGGIGVKLLMETGIDMGSFKSLVKNKVCKVFFKIKYLLSLLSVVLQVVRIIAVLKVCKVT